MKITIWTDGSAYPNPGPGGWCAVIAMHEDAAEEDIVLWAELIYGLDMQSTIPPEDIALTYVGEGQIARVKVLYGYADETTNNRMEITAILEATKSFKRPVEVDIVSDSAYAIGTMSGRFKAKANLDLLDEWRRSSEGFTLTWKHVSGHAGHPVNEFCDGVASEARKERLSIL